MIRRRDRLAAQRAGIEFPEVTAAIRTERQMEHLIEVAIVHLSLPAHVNGVAAHQAVDRGGVERGDEQFEIRLILSFVAQRAGEARDRQVRDGVEVD